MPIDKITNILEEILITLVGQIVLPTSTACSPIIVIMFIS